MSLDKWDIIRGCAEIIFLIIAGLFIFSKNRKTQKVMDVFKKLEKENNIVITKEISTNSNNIYRKLIVDDSKEKLYFISIDRSNPKRYSMQEINYSDVIDVELIQNRTYTSIGAGTEVIWGIGVFSSKTTENISRIGFRIIIKNINCPQIEIVIADSSAGISQSVISYGNEWASTMKVVMAKGKNI